MIYSEGLTLMYCLNFIYLFRGVVYGSRCKNLKLVVVNSSSSGHSEAEVKTCQFRVSLGHIVRPYTLKTNYIAQSSFELCH